MHDRPWGTADEIGPFDFRERPYPRHHPSVYSH